MNKGGQQKSTSIKVFIRLRPLVEQEQGTKQVAMVQPDGKTINLIPDSLSVMSIKFDEALPQQSTQRQVYSHFSEYIPKIPEGYNLTVFAYGQTGSGKTHTMFGKDWENMMDRTSRATVQKQNTFFQDISADENYAGIIPRAIFQLFEEIKIHEENNNRFRIFCSFLQIYNEKIYDLLQDFPKPKALNLHESKMDGIFVEGLAEYNVNHYLDCLELMKRGQKNRYIRQTSMNTKSSRSHTIFQILLESSQPDNKGMFKKARLNLCDLAGSQKVNKTESMNEDHFKELKNINQSLTTLGKVIASLSSVHKGIPAFRESKLTRLLQDSLTANTFTFIIGNISPSSNNADETMNTLKFVERARHIVMKVKPMEFNGQNLEIVNKLQKQIQYLKELLNLKRKGLNADDIHTRLLSLQEENEKLKKTSVSIQDVERLIQQNRAMKMEIHKLQMTQYAQSEVGGDTKSDMSLGFRKYSASEEIIQKNGLKGNKPHGFLLPKQQNTNNGSFDDSSMNGSKYTKKSLVSAGKNSVDSHHVMSMSGSLDKSQRNKQKQKILSKLEQLQRIQKFNEQKLMKDLEQLQKKNVQLNKNYTVAGSPMRKKESSTPRSPKGDSDRKVNYEDKIRELEAKLFGK